jgi:hypothetical protein
MESSVEGDDIEAAVLVLKIKLKGSDKIVERLIPLPKGGTDMTTYTFGYEVYL